MEELKVSYSFDYLKEVFNYILVPVFIVILIVLVGLFIYSRIEKDHTTNHYNYTINFWSYLMCIILSAALFAIALSFVVSLHTSIAGREVDKSNLIYLVYLSPIIPFVFLVSTGIHWIKMFLSYRESKKDVIEENNENNIPQEEPEEKNPFENLAQQEVEKTIEPIPVQTLSADDIMENSNENSEESIIINDDNVSEDEETESNEENNNLDTYTPLSEEQIEIPEVKTEPESTIEEPEENLDTLEKLEEDKKEIIPDDEDIEILDVLEEGDNK